MEGFVSDVLICKRIEQTYDIGEGLGLLRRHGGDKTSDLVIRCYGTQPLGEPASQRQVCDRALFQSPLEFITHSSKLLDVHRSLLGFGFFETTEYQGVPLDAILYL
jgi:hypothetical protein